MQINRAQRNMLLAASAFLALLWVLDVASEGLENSHWIIITPLVAGLLFVAFSSKLDSRGSADVPAVTPERLAANKGDEGQAVVAVRFTECSRQ